MINFDVYCGNCNTTGLHTLMIFKGRIHKEQNQLSYYCLTCNTNVIIKLKVKEIKNENN